MLLCKAVPLRMGRGYSSAIMINPRTIVAICTIGSLTIIVMKIATLGDGLGQDNVKINSGTTCSDTHCKPPGARRTPPMKSQKNLRKKKPHKLAHTASVQRGDCEIIVAAS